jgi:hypothetical protein
MAHHAYVWSGEADAGIEAALAFSEREFGLTRTGNPDLTVLRFQTFSVNEARALQGFAAGAPTKGEHRVIIVSAARLFGPAQNALLKLFEEPPAHLTLILIVPADGTLLPTMRSRVMPLPQSGPVKSIIGEATTEFLKADAAGRTKLITKLLERAKSDKDTEKQAARVEALHLAEDLARAAYRARDTAKGERRTELEAFLADLDTFIPILHQASAPLKPIFEHLLLVIPKDLVQ